MWQLLLDRFSVDPSWLIASSAIMVMMLVLVLWSFWRHARQLAWFSGAGLLTALVYVLANQGFLMIWSKLTEAISTTPFVSTLLYQFASEFLRYLLLYSLLALTLTLVLVIWSILTFRWKRCQIILQRSISESWLVVPFSVANVILLMSFSDSLGTPESIIFERIVQVFQMISFIYCLQLFLRLIDTAYLKTPKLFMEFAFATGLFMLLCSFVADWGMLFSALATGDALGAFADQSIFLQQLFSFFLGLMLIGYLAYFLVQGLFASTHFLESAQRRSSKLFRGIAHILLAGRKPNYSQQNILLGVVVSLFVGSLFLLLGFQGWSLSLIPAFFLGYFILFYLLDRQDDARVRGDIVEKRIESAHFFSS